MTLYHYVYPGLLDSLKPNLDHTISMLKIYSDKYGLYPFINEKYGHAQFNRGGAMEHQTCSSMGVFTEGVIAHELSHQWFGDKITCRDWHHIWLNEGFATYSECIYTEAAYGKTAFNSIVADKMFDAQKAKGTIYVQDITSIGEIFNGFRSYAKGGMVLHMLRGVVGDSVFFNILKTYLSDTNFAYKTAVTEDFQGVSERVSGKQLGYFFSEWIYGQNYPEYNISYTYNQKANSDYSVTVSLNQKLNTYPSFFTMPVDIMIKTTAGDTLFNVWNNQQSQNYTFTVKQQPVTVTFDPYNKILKDKRGDEPVEQVSYKLEQNYPNPFNPETNIIYEILKLEDVKIFVFDITGRKMTTLVNQKQMPGRYSVKFSGINLSSGIYFYKIIAGDFNDSKKMVLIR